MTKPKRTHFHPIVPREIELCDLCNPFLLVSVWTLNWVPESEDFKVSPKCFQGFPFNHNFGGYVLGCLSVFLLVVSVSLVFGGFKGKPKGIRCAILGGSPRPSRKIK